MAKPLQSKSAKSKAPAIDPEPPKNRTKEPEAQAAPVEPVNGPAAPVVSSYRMPEREDAPFAERLSLKINDGKVDFSSVRPSSSQRVREALKATFQDEEARKWLGIEAVTPQELEEIFSPEQAGVLLDTIVKIELIFATGTTKLPAEECERFLGWSEREHVILDRQAARVIARYVPAEWLKRLDLWIFLLTFITFTFMKFKKLNEHAAAVAKAAAKAVDEADRNPAAAREPQRPAEPPPAPANGVSAKPETGLVPLMPSMEPIQ